MKKNKKGFKMKHVKLVVVALLLSTLASKVVAFDDKREGFFMGLGLGAHNTSYKVEESYESKSGFSSSQKLGYGFNEHISVFLSRDDAWYSNSDEFVYCLVGVGARYHFSSRSNSMYITGSLGKSFLTNVTENTQVQGSGGVVGVGYEFYKHFNMELDVITSSLKAADKSEVDPVSFRWMFSYDLY